MMLSYSVHCRVVGRESHTLPLSEFRTTTYTTHKRECLEAFWLTLCDMAILRFGKVSLCDCVM